VKIFIKFLFLSMLMRFSDISFHGRLMRTGCWRCFWFPALACWFLLLGNPAATAAAAQNRIALVIGNGAYKTGALSNPAHDAQDMAAALTQSGFQVSKAVNATRKEMRRAIRDFSRRIRLSGSVGLFYYAGLGLQVSGENFLVPVDARVYSEAEVEDECLKVSTVLRHMAQAGNQLNIIILDTCRDNPFARSFRSGKLGLAKTAPGSVVVRC
jgi:uncharacterized caspase-like protein